MVFVTFRAGVETGVERGVETEVLWLWEPTAGAIHTMNHGKIFSST